jgi:hypothetical protein
MITSNEATPPLARAKTGIIGTFKPAAGVGLLCLLLIFLTACKVRIIVPAGGKVVSDNGFVCFTGAPCDIDISDENFDDTFHAVPDPGFVFSHWKKQKLYFCGDKTVGCHLYTTGFENEPVLLGILESDAVFYLEPVFVNKSGYNISYWANTLAQIDTGSHSSNDYLYSIAPNVDQCDPGALTEAAKNRALTALNNTRALLGLPPAEYDNFYDMQVQEASLVQRANNYLSHFPEPADTCYTASAETGSSTSNITGGPQADPASQIFGWANDNNNVASLMAAGHRRWIVFPELGYISYGQVQGYAAQKVFGFGQPPATPVSPDIDYVAFPFKTFPYVLVSAGDKPTPWSISIVPPNGTNSPFNYFANATVTVENAESGASLPVHSQYSDTQRFGLANFLSWMVDGWEYDTHYTVTIDNISMPDGDIRKVQYAVLLDRFNLFSVDGPLETGDSHQGTSLQGHFNTAMDTDSYTALLSGQHSFRGDSEFSNQAFSIRVYDSRKRLVKSSDQAFSMNFPAGTYTIMLSPCDENGLCYQNVKNYTVTY